ncbi:MAG: oxidoreductase domain protein [Acidimicrobiales bacterium]|nr:oxidoreductase domain protein [Acidimicrobiales bacterium]
MVDLAIIGAGIMGANHARVARSIADVRVKLVVDPDMERARTLAASVGADWAQAVPDDLAVDAAIVAAPADVHSEVALPILAAGVPVLVEKPIAETLDDARALVDAAAANDVILMVGHVEQFNTAVMELDRLLHDVVHMQADRVGPYAGRVKESVVLDLMIHDLDIVRRIASSPVEDVCAIARSTRSATPDYACALVSFQSGVTATVTASRIGQSKIRRLEIVESDDFVSVDLLRQDVTVHRVSHAEFLSAEGAAYRQSGVIEIPFLERRGEPLALEVQHFVDCVRTSGRPRVSGEDALETLALALRVSNEVECGPT